MNSLELLNDFEKELVCQYKGETYSVRDNGSILRHPQNPQKLRPKDNKWTFGKYSKKTGYAEIAGERVHRIVATAFLGEAPSSQHVVDHIDTNRRNNRPENLRWVTKLENILLNPITVKKIELLCGSVEEFLKDPSKLPANSGDRNFEWMRAVTKEEAAASLERMLNWSKKDIAISGGSLGEWIYNRGLTRRETDSKIPANTTLSEGLGVVKKVTETRKNQSKAKTAKDKSNPFDFPRPTESENVRLYRTSSEIFELLKAQLDLEKTIRLPNAILPTAGKGIVVRESWDFSPTNIEYCYHGKSRIPKYIIMRCENESVAMLIIKEKRKSQEEIDELISKGYNVFEIDLSWAKNGITDAEMQYILQTDITKKQWIYNGQIIEAQKKLEQICEPITSSGDGVAHSYFACPLTSDSVQDIDCWYCNYKIYNESIFNGYCFGKSGVQTYQDLLSITNVIKEDEKIVSITYKKDGKEITKKFDKEVQLPGKTLFQLWNEKTGNALTANNIYSGWYVLIESDPKVCFDNNGYVLGKLGRNKQELKNSIERQIFGFNDYCWELA
ncbi:MAG: HNH endonuclease [Clostridia bacterium]|nr:HNH endonuclease [Clostridia bacterium]